MRNPRLRANPIIALALGILFASFAPGTIAEEGLGRLFYSPERRLQLDRQREMNTLDKQPAIVEPLLTINGVVVRSSGKRTAWLNGNPQHDNEIGAGLAVSSRYANPGQVFIHGGDESSAQVRVGETVNRSNGKALDLLNGGQIRVRARPPTRQPH